PANLQVFARTSSGRVPVKEGGRFAFNGEGQVEVEDEDTNLRFFLPEDYAWAVADSLNDFSGRSKIRRFIYTDRGKDYMLVGVPWDWVNAAPKGNLIIDPTTTAVSNHDTRLQDGGNYGTGAVLAIGKPTGFIKRRTIIKLDLTGIPTNATVLNAQLKLWYYSNNGTPANNRWVQAHQLLVNWDELQATRDNRLTATPWAAQYGALDGTDANASYESTLLFSQTEQLLQWKTWDLSALTQKWVKVSGPGSAPNYGVVLWATNEDTDGHAMQFNSSEAASNQPYLEIIWSNTPKTVYFLKDHLGSIRATVLDSATAPVIGYEDYDPWGYPLAGRTKAIPNAYLQGASKNKFTGKGRDDEFGLNLDYFGARYYDHLVGRWISVDPLGAIHPEDSHYSYTGNEPINRVDPNGMDWFRNKGTGEVDWFETSAEGFSDQDRNSWQNVGTEAIYFNGVDLTAIVQEGNVIDGYNFDKLQVEAVSGRPLDGGEFDYSIERQLLLNEGPLPEGVYYINPQKTQYWRNLSWLDKFYALIGQGPWPGGLSSWGESRVWLQPNSIKLIDPRTGQEILRSSFSIHGGNTPGSGGCIDCYSNAPKFFGFISKLRSSSVPVIVDYKTNGGR
ncbi:MAG: DNRLRE domain-containing protein, partial [bacterium]